MNSITQALEAAGVKLPSKPQRIWQLLKDEGPRNVVYIAERLKIPAKSIYQDLYTMHRRKMLEKREVRGAGNTKLPSEYAAVGQTYEWLPPPKRAKPKPAQKAKPVPPTHVYPAAPAAELTYATITLRVPRGVAKIYEEHAKGYGVGVDDVVRLALEAYGKKMGLPMMALDPTQALRRKLEGGV